MKRPIQVSHEFLAEVITKDSVVVDATMGNGNDTVFLAKLAKTVYAFDIQAQALEKTADKLHHENLTNVQLILDGHEHVGKYVDQVDAAIFNLGYLPSADKAVITQPQTTLQALEQLLQSLSMGGRIAIMVYYGHQGGDMEKDAVLDYVTSLDQREFAAMLYKPLNQINTPPFLIMLEKLAKVIPKDI